MTKKEFLYAAKCNRCVKDVEKYIEENPKDDYDENDWMLAVYGDFDKRTAGRTPLLSELPMNGTHCRRSHQWTV